MSPASMIYTIGHSTRTVAEMLALLEQYGVGTLVDVRRFPGSKRYPHFSKEHMQSWLTDAGIEYRHLESLGGRRTPAKDSPNDSWRNPQFRGYADHMQSSEFRAALDQVVEWSQTRALALMCAEAVPWRCHRQMIADALVARGLPVTHVLALAKTSQHELNPAARVRPDGSVIYPSAERQLDLLS